MTTDVIVARDLSPLPTLTAEQDAWAARLSEFVSTSAHVLRFGASESADDGEDFLLQRDTSGRWWTGRYIGDITFEERRLEVRPRLGYPAIESWLADIVNVVAVPTTAEAEHSESFMARLLAAIWCRTVDEASRHGPPALRRLQSHQGPFLRGSLDVKATARLRSFGSPYVASVQPVRDMDNDIARVMVAADRVLTSRIGHQRWRPARVDELVATLRGVVGARPRVPTETDLARVRYTPITRPYKAAAELSRRLTQLEGLHPSHVAGESEGLLLDVAELWELYVLRAAQRAFPSREVRHGTNDEAATWLLASTVDSEAGMGQLKPDILVLDDHGAPVLVADAKYKRLLDRPGRRRGVERADLYQLTSYLARFAPGGEAPGALLYPDDPSQMEVASGETLGPWRAESGGLVHFRCLPLTIAEGSEALRTLVSGPSR